MMVIAVVIILLCGVVVALIGVFNRASPATGIGTIVAAGLALLGVVVAIFEADEVGGFLLLTGLASPGGRPQRFRCRAPSTQRVT